MNIEIKDINSDALQLCSEAIKQSISAGLIALEVCPDPKKYSVDLVYNYIETPFFLQKEGLLKLLPAKTIDPYSEREKEMRDALYNKNKLLQSYENSGNVLDLLGLDDLNGELANLLNNTPQRDAPSGLYFCFFDLEKIRIWVDKEMSSRVWKIQHDDPSFERDFQYENNELRIKLKNGSISTFDLSKAPVARDVFEAFYFLYLETGETYFDRDTILRKYAERTKKKISWAEFIKAKSSVFGKMMEKKPHIKETVKCEFNRDKQMYYFEIKPLIR